MKLAASRSSYTYVPQKYKLSLYVENSILKETIFQANFWGNKVFVYDNVWQRLVLYVQNNKPTYLTYHQKLVASTTHLLFECHSTVVYWDY